MHKNKTELYQLISDVKTKKEFEKEIKQRYKVNDGLFDEDAIALFIVDELGRNTQVVTKIAHLQSDKEYVVVGKISTVSDMKTFKRKDGTAGKVLNLEICDETGSCRLVLWNDEIDVIRHKEIQRGTTVRVINGYTKSGYTGVELHLGRWGLLEVEPEKNSEPSEVKTSDADEITGVLVHKEATRPFFKENGEFGFVTTITLKENEKNTEVTLWDTSVKEIQRFKIGEKVTLKNVTAKRSNGKTQLHINGNGTIHKHT